MRSSSSHISIACKLPDINGSLYDIAMLNFSYTGCFSERDGIAGDIVTNSSAIYKRATIDFAASTTERGLDTHSIYTRRYDKVTPDSLSTIFVIKY